jgi:hypothetical protein
MHDACREKPDPVTAEIPTYRSRLPSHLIGPRPGRRRRELVGPTARQAFGYAALAVMLALALLYLPLSWPEAPQQILPPPEHSPANRQ